VQELLDEFDKLCSRIDGYGSDADFDFERELVVHPPTDPA
jgi:hypothetical protein